MAGAPNKADETKPNTTDFFGHLSIGEKSKLKWEGNRQELKSFVETTLSLTGEWSSDDSTPMFKSNGITITFYDSKQNTLLIQGRIGDELKQHLLNIASETGDTMRLVVNDSTAKRFVRPSGICLGGSEFKNLGPSHSGAHSKKIFRKAKTFPNVERGGGGGRRSKNFFKH